MPEARNDSKLAELQRRFKAVVQGKSPNREASIRETELFKRDARLGVYQYAWAARLTEALLDDYPVTTAILNLCTTKDSVGSRAESVAREYVEENPSRSPTLTDLGRDFPAFLRARPELGPEFLPELATLEWSLIEAFYAPELPNRTRERLPLLADYPPSRVKLVLDPSVQLRHVAWPLDRIVDAEAPRDPEDTHLLIRRDRQGDGIFERVDARVFRMLAAARDGLPLDQILECAGDLAPERVQATFQTWVGEGLVVDLDFDSEA